MARMERDDLITLPKPLHKNRYDRKPPPITAASDPEEPIFLPAGKLGPLKFQIGDRQNGSRLWNELIERHHSGTPNDRAFFRTDHEQSALSLLTNRDWGFKTG